jgi:autotransporter-associated beta strand protein
MGVLTQSGGTINVQNEVYIGNENSAASIGTYTLSGTGVLNVGNEVFVGRDNGTGTFNLDGGTVNANKISGGSGSATVNFNGGVIRAKRDEANLIENLDTANVDNGGIKIDSNGFNVATSQAFSGTGGLEKSGSGSLTLSGASANTFTGMTTVSAGTLRLNKTAGTDALAGDVTVNSGAFLLISQSDQVVNNANVSLSGGTITRASGVSEVFGSLNLTDASFLDFGTGTTGSMTLGTYEENATPSALLTLNNFIPGNSFTFSNALFAADGSNIGSYFTFGTGFVDRSITANGGNSFTITAIPEPSTYLAAAGLLSLLLWPSRRRVIRDTKKILGLTPPMRDRLAPPHANR